MRNASLHQIAQYLGLFLNGSVPITGYQIDSRLIEEGNLFFALPGERTDGHQFLKQAKAKGAIAAVVVSNYVGSDFGLVLLRVQDVTAALQNLAKHFLKQSLPLIVGITGSVGKTTVKEFAATILQGKFRVWKNIGSYNTKLTLPLTILNRLGDEDVLVLEMGISEKGDMKALVEIARPDIAIVTKVALAHAANFPGGIDEIAQEKGEIFSHARIKIFDRVLSSYFQGYSFSVHDRSADSFLSLQEGRVVVDEKRGGGHSFDLPLISRPHVLHNFLAAIVIARHLKMSWDEITPRVPFLKLPKMRGDVVESRGVLFINDAYNANPESMRAALSSLPKPKEGGKRIAVLGSMKELGAFSQKAHEELGLFAQLFVDHLLVMGEEAKPLCLTFGAKAKFFTDHVEIGRYLMDLATFGDVVLIKGSRGMCMEKVLDVVVAH